MYFLGDWQHSGIDRIGCKSARSRFQVRRFGSGIWAERQLKVRFEQTKAGLLSGTNGFCRNIGVYTPPGPGDC
jgi:hypothetical protein